ncbi:MAG TPA: putative metalloprotease CJM1_0395 family protein [Patescibacteria group bacterium]|nr:putative metalloprotease CJM1_0395 family protein [Patescibacteria group bacterium]
MVNSVDAGKTGSEWTVLGRREDVGQRNATGSSGTAAPATAVAPAYQLSLSSQGQGLQERVTDQGTVEETLRLRSIDSSIRMHEAAHQLAGGGYAGGVSYLYRLGPDSREYVSGGKVALVVPMGTTPEETIRNMRRVKQAALAPADPSSQDLRVALQAAAVMSRMEDQIRIQQNGGTDAGGDFPHSIAELIVSQAARVARWSYTEGVAAYLQQEALTTNSSGMAYGEWLA